MRDNGDQNKSDTAVRSRFGKAMVMGSLGLGSVFAGTCLWVSADRVLPALSDGLGSLGYCAPALPGVLMLLGTALLGVALIRMQDR